MHAWLNASMHLSFRADACSSWDLHSDPSTLDGYQILVLAGHDEYWSLEMRDTVETFVRGGGHVAVFFGNSVWWQIRYENDGQLIVCYKSVLEDPLLGPDQNRVTSNWSNQSPGRPENSLIGVGFRYGWMGGGGGDLTVLPPLPGELPHPAFAGVVDAAGNVLTPFGAGQFGEMVMTLPSGYSRIQDWSDFEQKWFVAAGRNGLVLFYRPDVGVGVVGGFSRNVTEAFKELNRWDAGDFLGGWTNINGIHSSPPISPLFLPRTSVGIKVKVHLP